MSRYDTICSSCNIDNLQNRLKSFFYWFWHWGFANDEDAWVGATREESEKSLLTALDNGLNFIDTAGLMVTVWQKSGWEKFSMLIHNINQLLLPKCIHSIKSGQV
jgi:hypothetical protein